MTKEEFSAELDQAAQKLTPYPASCRTLKELAARLKTEPAWWLKIELAWKNRRFVSSQPAWSLLLASLHFEALLDPANLLARCYPSSRGTDLDSIAAAAEAVLAAAQGRFYTNLEKREVRTYAEPLASIWTLPAILFFQGKRLEYYLVEAGAGAGLNLASDLITPRHGFDSSLVAARIGIDEPPLDVSRPHDRLWLAASHYPEKINDIAAQDAMVARLLALKQEDAALIQLAPCPPALMPGFLDKNVPPDEERGLLVFNSWLTSTMSDGEYLDYKNKMRSAMAAWGQRGLWLELERPRTQEESGIFELRAHRLFGKELKTHRFSELRLDRGKLTINTPESSRAFLA